MRKKTGLRTPKGLEPHRVAWFKNFLFYAFNKAHVDRILLHDEIYLAEQLKRCLCRGSS